MTYQLILEAQDPKACSKCLKPFSLGDFIRIEGRGYPDLYYTGKIFCVKCSEEGGIYGRFGQVIKIEETTD